MGGCIRIEPLENGWTVEMDDPAIVKSNQKNSGPSSGDKYVPWRDPSRKFTFQDKKGVITFITKNLEKCIPEKKDDFETSFNMAAMEKD